MSSTIIPAKYACEVGPTAQCHVNSDMYRALYTVLQLSLDMLPSLALLSSRSQHASETGET